MGGLSGNQYVFDRLVESFKGFDSVVGYDVSIIQPFGDRFVRVSLMLASEIADLTKRDRRLKRKRSAGDMSSCGSTDLGSVIWLSAK